MSIASDAVAVLRRADVQLAPGLTPAEVAAVEHRFGFRFNFDHRELLGLGLPTGDRWPDWRAGTPAMLAERLAAPVAGVLFDVEHNGFWWPGWGPRPAGTAAALAAAAGQLRLVPRLVPVYAHRFAPADPCPPGSPVLSVHQSDVMHYGSDLADYCAREFLGAGSSAPVPVGRRVAFWSELAVGR